MQTAVWHRVGVPFRPCRGVPSLLAMALLAGLAQLSCVDDRVPGLDESESELMAEGEVADGETTAGQAGPGAASSGTQQRPTQTDDDIPSTSATPCDPENGKTGCSPPAPRPATCSEPGGCRQVCVVGLSRVGACAIR